MLTLALPALALAALPPRLLLTSDQRAAARQRAPTMSSRPWSSGYGATRVRGAPPAPAESVLAFEREPENVHDPSAICVTCDGERMGYLMRELARTLSVFIDSGEMSLKPLLLSPEQLAPLTALRGLPLPSSFPLTSSGLNLLWPAVALRSRRCTSGSTPSQLHKQSTSTSHAENVFLTDGLWCQDATPEPCELPPKPRDLPAPVASLHCTATPALG